MRLLVVEDEAKVASFVKKGLEAESYAVDVAHDGEEGLHLARTEDYDLILLDILLPKLNGYEVLRGLRDAGIRTPVIMLTARGGLDDRVKGLDLGADDYLVKPFAFEELLARVRALLRRRTGGGDPTLRVGPLALDPVAHKVSAHGEPVDLTAKEYALLEYLMRNEGVVCTRAMIAQHVWDINFDTYTNLIDVFINHLRKKLQAHGCDTMVQTVRGVGYVLTAS
ncbi:MAG TPA: response regulator transcription factor [Planctomycetota bacterium]|nr:response regulator transcription factor [Planctomycetota bacterium]HRR81418.1 response regulator transcription factor [Planctomycetota bacterium]HRT94823.1 response regulator transcription factor [Planctomycetota bacterium]